jgi:2-phosphosulfolactate phosphatase
MTFYNQRDFQLRCEWGRRGVEQLAPISDVVIIVDVLSFSTCVEIAGKRGAILFPYPWKKEAAVFAASIGAELAAKRGDRRPAVLPVSLTRECDRQKILDLL